MSQDLQEMKKELQRLRERRIIETKAVERAMVRATGRHVDPSNRSFATSLTKDLNALDKQIAELKSEINKIGTPALD